MYKITIEKITKTEYPEQSYIYRNKETHEEEDYDYNKRQYKDYADTGRALERKDVEEVYSQKSEKDIDLKKVIDAFN